MCGSQRQGLPCGRGQHGEKTNRHTVVFANGNINQRDLASDMKNKAVSLLIDNVRHIEPIIGCK